MKQILSSIMVEDGDEVIIAGSTASNDDWIRAGRLKRQANAGDEEAKRKLQEMENTEMVEYIEEEA